MSVSSYLSDVGYSSAVETDYDSEYTCQGSSDEDGSCDSICRCRSISNARVIKVSPHALYQEIVDQMRIKDLDDLTKYCIYRFITHSDLVKEDSWEVNTHSGYYGEEISGAEYRGDIHKIESMLDALVSASDNNKIEIILLNEYKELLDNLKDLDWSVDLIDVNEIKNEEIMLRTNEQTVGFYNDLFTGEEKFRELPVCVVKEHKGGYQLIDGRHRLSAFKNVRELYQKNIALLLTDKQQRVRSRAEFFASGVIMVVVGRPKQMETI